MNSRYMYIHDFVNLNRACALIVYPEVEEWLANRLLLTRIPLLPF